jgi:hypothetical protein
MARSGPFQPVHARFSGLEAIANIHPVDPSTRTPGGTIRFLIAFRLSLHQSFIQDMSDSGNFDSVRGAWGTNPLRVSDASLALTEPNGQPCLTPTPSLSICRAI